MRELKYHFIDKLMPCDHPRDWNHLGVWRDLWNEVLGELL